jgi:hypothetical protein
LALILLVPLLEVLLVVHGQQRLGIGILGRLPPAVHLFGEQTPFPAVSTQLSGIQPSGLQHERELVGSAPAIWVFRRCRHHFPLQTPVMPPVVEGGDMDAELFGNLSNTLSLRWAHTPFHLSFHGLAVTTH